MSDVTATLHSADAADIAGGAPGDFVALLKPRVMSLVIFTALAGMLVAPVRMHPVIGFAALLAIAIGAGASGALNMWYDRDIDALMSRTSLRPIPSGRVEPQQALAFGLTLSAFSVVTLGVVTNWLAAFLLAFTIFFYVVIYSMWLKRWTPQNIVIGGAAGALPPVVSWAAATGTIGFESIVLFAIIFFWTPPHFWALALFKCADYGRAGVPMMPNVKGVARTRLEIFIYTLILAPVGMAPYLLGYEGVLYGAIAGASGLYMIHLAWNVWRDKEGRDKDRAAKRLFGYSILYLFLLFAVLVAEHGILQPLGLWG
ncbi:MAG: heme o synthase [Beijerinckiaceae bacterium]